MFNAPIETYTAESQHLYISVIVEEYTRQIEGACFPN